MRLSMRLLKRKLLLIVLVIMGIGHISWTIIYPANEENANQRLFFFKPYVPGHVSVNSVYDSIHLADRGLSENAFMYAMHGFQELKDAGALQNDSILTILDFDQPSYNKRLYVLDVKHYKIIFNTWAAHGKNTGREWARSFSNRPESNKTSLGFYITENPYYGTNGFSLKLMGVERNLNDRALERGIVIHGAPYVSQSYISSQGFIGRSFGCPAVPESLNRPLIEKIKNGSCLFIYNKSYQPTATFSIS